MWLCMFVRGSVGVWVWVFVLVCVSGCRRGVRARGCMGVCVFGCRCLPCCLAVSAVSVRRGVRARGCMGVCVSGCRCLPCCPAVSVVSVLKPNLEHQCESLACVASVPASVRCACLGVGCLSASRVCPALGVCSLWSHSSAQHDVHPRLFLLLCVRRARGVLVCLRMFTVVCPVASWVRTAATRNFGCCTSVPICYEVQRVRRGNAAHQPHGRRDVCRPGRDRAETTRGAASFARTAEPHVTDRTQVSVSSVFVGKLRTWNVQTRRYACDSSDVQTRGCRAPFKTHN